MSVLIFILALSAASILFDLAALHWGYDSRDNIDNAEWDRRRWWNLRLHHFS